MRIHPLPPHPRRAHRGMALVISLGFIVLLTGLITTYLLAMRLDRKTTHNYSHAVRAQELAKGALVEILDDLHSEIEAGSQTDADLISGENPIYLPTTARTAVPARIGVDDTALASGQLPPTLVRVSRAVDDFYTNPPADYGNGLPPARASSVPTDARSTRGRYVSADRWNKPLLLGATTPVAFADNMPEWVYMTRSGSRSLTDADVDTVKVGGSLADEDQVVGRYAYVVYEQGGLLDVNVAGFPSSMRLSSASPAEKAALRGKSLSTYADMRVLPGLEALDSELDEWIAWRNQGSVARDGNYLDAVTENASHGFLEQANGDSPLLGRQDLIDYFERKDLPESALAYLTTFSRAVHAPTWRPAQNADAMDGFQGGPGTAPIAYADLALDDDAANPAVSAIRLTDSGTVTHYDDEGNPIPTDVVEGGPAVSRRFSLAKLNWLTDRGPRTGISDAAVQACFGLRWNGADGRWEYVGSVGNVPQTRIKTLGEVAQELREPNFFELLKAGILEGSLGRDPGELSTAGGFVPTNSIMQDGPCGEGYELYSVANDQQIARIAANIIDQADEDSYPTAIYFPIAPEPTVPEHQPINTVYGVENLPYLSKIDWVSMQTGEEEYQAWCQPELWNPHQAHDGSLADVPTQFRLRAYGQAVIFYGTSQSGQKRYSPPLDFNVSSSQADATIFLNDLATGTPSSPFYERPAALDQTLHDVSGTDPVNLCQQSDIDQEASLAAEFGKSPESNPQMFVGFHSGTIADFTVNPVDGNSPKHRIMPSPMLTFALEYRDRNGVYRPYSYISRVRSYYYQDFSSRGRTKPKVYWAGVDPRQHRFSVHLASGGHGNNMQGNTYRIVTNPDSARTAVYGYPEWAAGFHYWQHPAGYLSAPVGEIARNTLPTGPSDKYAYYVDPDGVVRWADGARRDEATANGYQQLPANYKSATAVVRRPVVLNRPFRSVAELGYVYRDLPYRSLDMWSPESADAALLDLFAVRDEPQVVAGHLNLNFAPPEVMEAMLAGAGLMNSDLSQSLNGADAAAIARAIRDALDTAGTPPLQNRADLVSELSETINAAMPSVTSRANKTFAETPVRALGDATNLRTWNLLIDVIAQSGVVRQGADSLDDFVVEGERRIWLHVALDRYTGEVVDQQIEYVYD